MYAIDKYNPTITIELDNGIYIFDCESATGKTRLCKELRKLQAYGEAVASYTYDDLLIGIPVDNIFDSDKYKVIMLDRYDLYKDKWHDKIRECSKNSIVLIDCKGEFSASEDDEVCFIEMTADRIEVMQ